MTMKVSNPGPSKNNYPGRNNFSPSFGIKTTTFAAELKRALKRETDEQVIRRWAGKDRKFNLAFLKPYKFDKPVTRKAILAELGRQAKRMPAGAGDESITAARVHRGSIEERDLYNDWMAGNH